MVIETFSYLHKKQPSPRGWVFFCPSLVGSFDYNTAPLKNERAVYMGRKKNLVNNTNIPQYAIERFARCVFDDIRADFAKPEVQDEFAQWLAEREHKKTRAAISGGSVALCGFLFSWPSGFGIWPNGCAIGEILLFVSLEINK